MWHYWYQSQFCSFLSDGISHNWSCCCCYWIVSKDKWLSIHTLLIIIIAVWWNEAMLTCIPSSKFHKVFVEIWFSTFYHFKFIPPLNLYSFVFLFVFLSKFHVSLSMICFCLERKILSFNEALRIFKTLAQEGKQVLRAEKVLIFHLIDLVASLRKWLGRDESVPPIAFWPAF